MNKKFVMSFGCLVEFMTDKSIFSLVFDVERTEPNLERF